MLKKSIKVADKTINLDAKQIEILHYLENLQKQVKNNQKTNLISRIFTKNQPIKNLYIYGKVGRGKSMLMRHFFDNLPQKDKAYFHFNNFMQQIHKKLHILRQNNEKKTNLVASATKNLLGNIKILCFDEMQVEDVADAMILQEVFCYLQEQNVTIVTTSNCHPLELYENGLQRDLFLQFVNEILLKNFLILNLDGAIDYRSAFLKASQHYFYPNNTQNKKQILDILQQLIDEQDLQEQEIDILGSRKLLIKKTYKNIAVFDFKELCAANLSTADYAAICQKFSTIFLLDLPILKPEDRNEAKRLIWFIDEAYENNTQIVTLAEGKAEDIYVKGIGAKAFKRTASRLNEI